MFTKELWIILRNGLDLFHYQARGSEYENMDSSLFAGFITALSDFALSMSNKQIQYLKLQDDELYFIIKGEIIVVSIIDALLEVEKSVLTQLLDYIGDKFLEKYGQCLKNKPFNWESVDSEFSQEVEILLANQNVFEELKREQINNLFNKVLHNKLSPDILYMKIIELSMGNSNKELVKTVDMIENLLKILPTTKVDIIAHSKIENALQNVHAYLLKKLVPEKFQLFVLCKDNVLYEEILGTFLVYGTVCNQFRSVEALYKSIQVIHESLRKEGLPILLADPSISLEEIMFLTEKEYATKIFYWSIEKPSDTLVQLSQIKENVILLPPVRCLFKQGCPKFQEVLKEINNTTNLLISDSVPLL